MSFVLEKRHREVPGCVWQPGMVGPECRPPSAVKKAAMAGKDSYYEMAKYSRITTWVLLALLGLVVLRSLFSRVRHSSNSRLSSVLLSIPGYRTLVAVCRGVGYYRPKRIFRRKTVLSDRFPSLGNILFITIPFLGFTIWCFAIKPYYRPAAVWGSTPLGVRAGMIANAFFPWLFCFALKFNPLTMLTSISHEKLQFYHQWTARIILFFSIVHAVPFLYQPVHDGGWSNLTKWFWWDPVWWTGTAAIVIFFWLVVSSFGYFRRMSYEFFVFQHVVTIILFLVFYFMHTRDMLTSWSWLWPTIGIWGFHVLFKFANSLRISKFGGVTGVVSVVDEDEKLIKLEVVAPVSWQAGQHFFLRFPGLNKSAPYQTHPFTVSNLPSPDSYAESRMIFYFKARDGLTRSLWERVMRQPSVKGKVSTKLKVGLDGPYGSPFHPEAYCAAAILVGGVGITSALPSLMSLCLAARKGKAATKRVAVHWAVQSLRIYEAFEATLVPLVDHLRALGIEATLDVYCKEAYDEKSGDEKVVPGVKIHSERAVVPDLITAFVDGQGEQNKTVGVSVCGPASMLNETANTVAKLQWTHVLGKASKVDEVFLHTEAFDW